MTEEQPYLGAYFRNLQKESAPQRGIYIPLRIIELKRKTKDDHKDSRRSSSIRENAKQRYQQRETQNDTSRYASDPIKAIDKYSHILISGEPGEGKTTLCNHIAGEAVNSPNKIIPVKISLREYRTNYFHNFTLREAALRQFDDKHQRSIIEKEIERGNVLWLIDGLDEAGASISQVLDSIVSLPGKIIVTSRPTSTQYAELSDFNKFIIAPLLPESVKSFAGDWFSSKSSNKHEINNNDFHVDQFKLMLNERPLIQSLTKNALLLTILLSIFEYRGMEKFPNNRFEIYEEYLNLLYMQFHDRDDIPLITAGIQGETAKRILLEGLYYIGWTLQLSSYSGSIDKEPTESKLIEALQTYFSSNSLVPDNQKLNAASDIINFWKRCGLFEEINKDEFDKNKKFAFQHLSFQEFAASVFITRAWNKNENGTWKFLHPRLHHYAWREPILLACGQMDSTQVNHFVTRVLNSNSPFEKTLRRDLSLAGEIIAQSDKVSETIKKNVISKMAWCVHTHERGKKLTLSCFYLLGLLATAFAMPFWYNLIAMTLWTIIWCLAFVGFPITFILQIIHLGGIDFLDSYIPNIQKLLMLPASLLFPKVYPLQLINSLSKVGKGNNAAIDALIGAAWHHDLSCSNAAVTALGDIGDSRATKHLIALLYDHYHGELAIQALEKINDPTILDELLPRIENHFNSIDYRLYPAVISLLGNKNPDEGKVVPILIRYMKTDYEELRIACEEALIKISTINSANLLLHALLPDEWYDSEDHQRSDCAGRVLAHLGRDVIPLLSEQLDKQFSRTQDHLQPEGDRYFQKNRCRALLRVISRIKDKRFANPLMGVLEKLIDSEQGEYAQAITELLITFKSREINSFIVSVLDSKDHYIRSIIADEMIRAFTSNPYSYEYLVALHARDLSYYGLWDVWQTVRKAWNNSNSDWVPFYIGLLSHNSDNLREYAWAVLLQTPDSRLETIYIEQLRDVNPKIRGEALYGLQNIRKLDYIPLYIDAFLCDPTCMGHALNAIVKTIDPAYQTPLRLSIFAEASITQPLEINAKAVSVLKKNLSATFYQEVEGHIFDDDHYLSDAAFEILCFICDETHFNGLVRIVRKDMNGYSSRSMRALALLGKIRNSEVVSVLRESLYDQIDTKRKVAAKSLGSLGDSSVVPDLITLFGTGFTYEADEAEKAIKNIGLSKSITALITALKDPNPFIRENCARLLGEAKSTEAASRLADLLKNDPEERVRVEAAKALGNIKSTESVEILLSIIRSKENNEVQQATVKALSLFNDQSAKFIPFFVKLFDRDCMNASKLNLKWKELLFRFKLITRDSEDWYIPFYRYKVLEAVASVGGGRELGIFVKGINHSQYHEAAFAALSEYVRRMDDVAIWKKLGQALSSTIWFNQSAYINLSDIAGQMTEKEVEGLNDSDPSIVSESKLRTAILPILLVIVLAILALVFQVSSDILKTLIEKGITNNFNVLFLLVLFSVLAVVIHLLQKQLNKK